jgi:uncharacterized protein (TIGR04255 family)
MSLDFEFPPINEVVFGVFFPVIDPLRAEAVGLYWNKIRNAFPLVVQQPLYTQVPQLHMAPRPGELFPLPRFWFFSEDKTRLIQLQNSAFLYNWRKQAGDYPRFTRVSREFFDELDRFQRYLIEDLQSPVPGYSSAELTYINLFGSAEGISMPKDYRRVVDNFPEHNQLGQNANLENFHHVDAFRLPNADQVVITQRSARQPLESGTQVVLEIKVIGSLTVSLTQWLNAAHETINSYFERVTSADIQEKIWKKRNEPSNK